MSIHTFSSTAFTDIAKEILLNSKFVTVQNPEKLTAKSSFKKVHNIDSIDLVELTIALELRYNLHLDPHVPESIDCINDVYKSFIAGMANKHKEFTQKLTLQNQRA